MHSDGATQYFPHAIGACGTSGFYCICAGDGALSQPPPPPSPPPPPQPPPVGEYSYSEVSGMAIDSLAKLIAPAGCSQASNTSPTSGEAGWPGCRSQPFSMANLEDLVRWQAAVESELGVVPRADATVTLLAAAYANFEAQKALTADGDGDGLPDGYKALRSMWARPQPEMAMPEMPQVGRDHDDTLSFSKTRGRRAAETD